MRVGTHQPTLSCPITALKCLHGGTRNSFPSKCRSLRSEFSSAVRSLPLLPLLSKLPVPHTQVMGYTRIINSAFVGQLTQGFARDSNIQESRCKGCEDFTIASISNNFTGALKFSRMLIQFIQAPKNGVGFQQTLKMLCFQNIIKLEGTFYWHLIGQDSLNFGL